MKKTWPIIAALMFTSCLSRPIEKEISVAPITRLLEGNKRYVKADLLHPHQSMKRLKEISEAQHPFAVVVSCSDSRVPPEIIFDQGLGDLFVIRTAGNVIGDYELASIEYAVMKLHCKVVMVVGHEKCGAIESFANHPNSNFPGHLNALKDFILAEPNSEQVLKDSVDHNYHAVIHNIIYGVQLLKNNSDIIKQKFDASELDIYGAIYHLKTGQVQVIEADVNTKKDTTSIDQ
jgi:carbonic anhydrase